MSNIFSLFGGKPPVPPADGKIPYKAFTCYDPDTSKYRAELGILMRYGNGIEEAIYYSYLVRVIGVPPNSPVMTSPHCVLTLKCTNYIYTVFGKNLMPLLPLLRDHHVRTLEGFNPEIHTPLAEDSTEPLIMEFLIQNPDEWWKTFGEQSTAYDKAHPYQKATKATIT
jgi:hypothetical protein